jgi:hypothetical protein
MLSLAFIQDQSTQQQQISNAAAGMGAAFIIIMLLVCFALAGFIIFMLWRVFTKAGMNGALSLLVLIPFGLLIVLAILAFGDWKVVPIAEAAPLPPPYTPPSYPPASYPPSQPPTA